MQTWIRHDKCWIGLAHAATSTIQVQPIAIIIDNTKYVIYECGNYNKAM